MKIYFIVKAWAIDIYCLLVLVHSPNVKFVFSQTDGTDLFNFVHGYSSWADYLRSMEKDGTWGDHLILLAAANCYKTPIRVISSLDRDITINPDHLVGNNSSLVLGHIGEKHYVSLREGNSNVFDPEIHITLAM